MTVPQRVCSECSDDNGSVHSVIWLLSAEYCQCQCQQRSGAPATEYDRRQPWNHPESAADLSRFLRAKSRYQDTQSTIVFPLNNSSHSLFNLRSWRGVKPVHSYNLETTAPKLATAPLVAAPALQYGVWLQVLSGYGQI